MFKTTNSYIYSHLQSKVILYISLLIFCVPGGISSSVLEQQLLYQVFIDAFYATSSRHMLITIILGQSRHSEITFICHCHRFISPGLERF